MDAHSNPRRAVKSPQEQEDWRRGAETKETVLDVLQRQLSERLRKRREKDRARRAAQTASEKTSYLTAEKPPWTRKNGSWKPIVSCQTCFSLGTRLAETLREIWDRVIIMQRPQHMLPQLPLFQQCSIQAKISCKHGYIGHDNMLYLFRKISWLAFTQA